MPLTIPNTAPFSGAQRMWLKGFLDGLNQAITPPAESPPAPGLPVTILWGSQTGNAEALGKKLSKQLAANGHSPTLRDLSDVSPADLVGAGHIFVITSTYGDGEPPDNAAALHAALAAADAPRLTGLPFAVFALGDSNYPDFCQCGRDFHDRLSALDAEAVLPLIEADVEFDEPFANWSRSLGEKLTV